MNRTDEAQVFVLDTPHGAVRALPLEQVIALAGLAAGAAVRAPDQLPLLAAAWRRRGAVAVCVTSPGAAPGRPIHWLDTAQARGWASGDVSLDIAAWLPAWQARLADGHGPADAALLAWPALPWLSWGDQPAPARLAPTAAPPSADAPLGLYAIVDSAAALRRVLQAGVRTVQLRVKRPTDADAAWASALRAAVRDSLLAAADQGALLFINDHWRLAAELGARAVHLGQEDLLALGEAGRAELGASGLGLGVSSHAVWELCRARSLAPRYIACGPVWPTTTKDMPWRPQGLDNLAWWCRSADAPVVAIGGILTPDQVRQAAAAGASGVCVLRGLGPDPLLSVGALQQAFAQGRHEAQARAGQPLQPLLRPHPTLGPAP